MDKKDIVLIALCILVMMWGIKFMAPAPVANTYKDDQGLPVNVEPGVPGGGGSTSIGPDSGGSGVSGVNVVEPVDAADMVVSADFADLEPAKNVRLSVNDDITYVVDPEHGGFRHVTLNDQDMVLGHPDEVMFAIQPATGEWPFSHAKVLEQDAGHLRIARQVKGLSLIVEQTWTLDKDDPHLFTYDVVLRNSGEETLDVSPLLIQAGAMEDLGTPRGFMNSGGIDQRIDLRFTGKKSPKTYPLAKVRKFDDEDRLELISKDIDWMAVQNKYFATIMADASGNPLPGVETKTSPVLTMALVPEGKSESPTYVGHVYRLDKKKPDLQVTLVSSDPAAVSLPAQVTISAMESLATFEVTINDKLVNPKKPVRLEAMASGMDRGQTTYPAKPLTITGVHVAEDLLIGYTHIKPGRIEAGKEAAYKYSIYLGPKQFDILEALGDNKESLMQFDLLLLFHFKWFQGISRVILWGITKFESIFNSYGIAIMLVTLILRLVFWPITHRSTVMSRKMQMIAPIAKELREKYGSDPQKLHQKTMEIYKEHKINPLSGCLPAVLQIPAFFALYNVLRSSIELRHASFLWAFDLSQPDTVAYLFALPINPLAIIMAATMVLHMKIVPTGSDPNQQRMMMIMSMSFLIFLYTMPSGLTLYWASNQILNIIQFRITHKLMDKAANQAPATA